MSILQYIDKKNNNTDAYLAGYGWHMESETDELDIFVDDNVYFYDDETDTWNYGTFCGFYEDFGLDSDCSPYMNEVFEGIERVVVQEAIENPDGGYSIRRNYILVENIYSAVPRPDNRIIAEWVA